MSSVLPVPDFSGDNHPIGFDWGRHPDEYPCHRQNSCKRRSDDEEPPARINLIRPDPNEMNAPCYVVRTFSLESLRGPKRRRPDDVI